MKACLRQADWSGLGLAVLWVATSVGLMHMYPRVWKSFALTTGSVSVDTVILSPVCCGVGVAYGARLRRAGVTRTSRAWPRSATAPMPGADRPEPEIEPVLIPASTNGSSAACTEPATAFST